MDRFLGAIKPSSSVILGRKYEYEYEYEALLKHAMSTNIRKTKMPQGLDVNSSASGKTRIMFGRLSESFQWLNCGIRRAAA